MTAEMQNEMIAMLGSSDQLCLWREDQKRKGVDPADVELKLKDFDPGLTSFGPGDRGPYQAAM